MKERYFYLNDLRLIGKMVEEIAYLYKNKLWEEDTESIIKHRLEGYDFITKTFHNTYMMIKIDEVTKENAEHLMNLV